ncbi:MAG: hypothetical protein AMDU1_APLC00001G0064 [Thermoplasmatales archaeon A-plasma]|nr:MAG: hypothetical protein AMDU1_APLC00001G0064 [Thermoplasmatales archaeon A-plasma]
MRDLFSSYWKWKIAHLNSILDRYPKFRTLPMFRISTCLRVAWGFVLSYGVIDNALVGISSLTYILECINAYREPYNDPNLYERLRRWYQ